MNTFHDTPITTLHSNRFMIWLVAVLFVLFQFFLQLSSGVILGVIMQEQGLSAFVAGLLSSILYILYTALQIPGGLLFDRKNARFLLAINALLCSFGCLLFALNHSLTELFLGRALIGIGAAFAFIGLSHLLRQYFPLRHFAFMIGLSETLGFIVTVIGMLSMGTFINRWGWQPLIFSAGLIGIIISYLCWHFIPNTRPLKLNQKLQIKPTLMYLLTNKMVWINGCFVGLNFTVITAFGALWAVPFIQVKLLCNLEKASMITAFFFLGTAFSCPVFGYLSTHYNRRFLILSSCFLSLFTLLLLLYFPSQSPFVNTIWMLLCGLFSGAYMLAYSIANELAPTGALSTCAGFTNMLAVLLTPLLQPFIGYLLDWGHPLKKYTLGDYQRALITIPLAMLVAGILAWFLPPQKKPMVS